MLSELCKKSLVHHIFFDAFPVTPTPARNLWISSEIKRLSGSGKVSDLFLIRSTHKLLSLKIVLSRRPCFLVNLDWCTVEVGEFIVGVISVVELDRPCRMLITLGTMTYREKNMVIMLV